MQLRYGELTLRNARAADAQQLCLWWNDGRVMAHAGFPRGLDTTAEAIADDLRMDTDSTRRRLIMEHCGRPIGEMSYCVVAPAVAEIGIKICDFSYQERGLGKQALSLLIKALFDMGCGRIRLDTNLNNLRAQHVYERLGFQKMGVRKNCWRDQLGVLQSAVDYELTPRDFIDFAPEPKRA